MSAPNSDIPETSPSSTRRACDYRGKQGARCRAIPLIGSGFCFFHNPALAKQRAAARRAGGVSRTRKVVLPEMSPNKMLRTARDVADLLSETINQVRTGQLDLRVSNAVGYLSGILLTAIERSSYEDRLATLEAIVANQPRSTRLPSGEDCVFDFVLPKPSKLNCDDQPQAADQN